MEREDKEKQARELEVKKAELAKAAREEQARLQKQAALEREEKDRREKAKRERSEREAKERKEKEEARRQEKLLEEKALKQQRERDRVLRDEQKRKEKENLEASEDREADTAEIEEESVQPRPSRSSRGRSPGRGGDRNGDVRTKSPTASTRSPRADNGSGDSRGWDNSVTVDPEIYSLSPIRATTRENRAKVDAVIQEKLDKSFSEKSAAIRRWVDSMGTPIPIALELKEALKSGVRLCRMLNQIAPGSILDISNLQSMKRENIINFLDSLRRKGFKSENLFVVDDLFEGRDIEAVFATIIHLDAYATQIGFDGPQLEL